jgi:hypothetical protein
MRMYEKVLSRRENSRYLRIGNLGPSQVVKPEQPGWALDSDAKLIKALVLVPHGTNLPHGTTWHQPSTWHHMAPTFHTVHPPVHTTRTLVLNPGCLVRESQLFTLHAQFQGVLPVRVQTLPQTSGLTSMATSDSTVGGVSCKLQLLSLYQGAADYRRRMRGKPASLINLGRPAA